jgi:membrane protease YdiL (CAAX protease family)
MGVQGSNVKRFLGGVLFLALTLYILNSQYPGDNATRLYYNLSLISLVFFSLTFVLKDLLKFDGGLQHKQSTIIKTSVFGAIVAVLITQYIDLIPQSIIGIVSLKIFFQVVNASLLEEFFFRMMLYPTLRSKYGKLGGAIIHSIVWTFLHLSAAFTVGGGVKTLGLIFIVGVVIALVNDSGKRYNTWFGISLHFVHNLLRVI